MLNLPEKELEILKLWQEKNIFRKTLAQASQGNFIFYEGPPTANGRPGIHHVLARAFKDVIPRYKTMQGFRVDRKAGWDTHGLPVELEVEKKLGLKNKKEVEAYGIEAFNEKCKESVWNYIEEWEKMTSRIGFWVDMDHPYVTYSNDYIESLWSIIKQIFDKNLMYKGYKVIPQCPRCGTALSSHEVAQGYKNVEEDSVTIEFRLINEKNTSILAWTTTPWTLPGNVALAVGQDIDYVKIEKKDQGDGELVRFILAKAKLEKIFGSEDYKIVEEFKGKDLIGLEYEPLFPGVITNQTDNYQNAFKVYAADFVSTEDGTGVVHTAVMYGLEDYELGEQVGLPKVHTVNLDGTFNELVPKWQGLFVKDVQADIVKDLAERGILFEKEVYKHDYPFCWRCSTPLIYYAKDSWYFKISALRDELLKNNAQINWVPEHIKEGRFGEWLKEIKDWAISRERYWGTPLPVWQCQNKDCGHLKVIGSYAELDIYEPLNNSYYLLRHGEAENNIQDILCSRLEDDHYGLTSEGREMVKKNLLYLKEQGLDLIFHSPFQRTTETAKIIAEELNLELIREDALWEAGLGDAHGKNDNWVWETVGNTEKRLKVGWPNGEKTEEMRSRMKKLLLKLEQEYSGKKILLVSHGDPLTELVSIFMGKTEEEAWKNNYVYLANLKHFDKIYKKWQTDEVFDPHRPFIDQYVLKCDKCASEMKRVPEVMDCWFDSGSMPLAQNHYPFENKNAIDSGEKYPAEFIAEAIDQTRGWFYTLLAVATLLDQGTPYKNVICLGHILDAQGLKMSKSKGNIVDPWQMIDKYGADALRWHLYTINQPGEAKRFDEKGLQESARIFGTLFNVLSFYQMYVDKEKDLRFKIYDLKEMTNVLDQWLASKLNLLIKEVTECLAKYDIFTSARKIAEFIEELSTWYLRRSRERFKGENEEDKKQAIFSLGKVLFELAKVLAPYAPFAAEFLYQELGKKCGTLKESVHLETWPEAQENLIAQSVLDYMALTRKIVEIGLAKRAEAGIKVRQPLAKLKVKSQKSKLNDEYLNLIKDELNVKEVQQEMGEGELTVELDLEISEELKAEGMLRELVRAINNKRKEMGLTINDRVFLQYETESEILKNVFEKYGFELQKSVLADSFEKVTGLNERIKIGEEEMGVKINLV